MTKAIGTRSKSTFAIARTRISRTASVPIARTSFFRTWTGSDARQRPSRGHGGGSLELGVLGLEFSGTQPAGRNATADARMKAEPRRLRLTRGFFAALRMTIMAW